ncbi:hypothetical protein OsJ_02071 [Oryza sativa Japonica Group]|uniref:SANTA domain-containing protein n=1 Tax=Oryza sativa subsp. japonica TaxID=39947 RepID=B9EXB3_ORYSJ|nr:hypothetical protein OsJ_02071 [Oryza sativa Japonica Group]
MATQPRAGDGAAAAAAAKEAPAVSYLQACVELDDWWLERVEGEEGKVRVVGSNTTTSRAGRRFTSASIKTRHASGDLETEDGIIIMIARPPNISKMHLNGFPDEGSRSDADRFPSERLSNSSNGRPTVEDPTANTDCNVNFMGTLATSEEFCTGRMDMPEEPRATPSETCGNDQENNQHLCMLMNTCENGNKVQHGTSSVGPSVVPAEKYVRSKAEQDALLVNDSTSHVSSVLGDCATPKCGKSLTHLGTKDALETNEGMNPQFGVPQGSEGSTVRRLRNGKVIVISTSASTKKVYKRARMQDNTFSENVIPNKNVTCPTGLISQENVC